MLLARLKKSLKTRAYKSFPKKETAIIDLICMNYLNVSEKGSQNE